MKQHAPQPEPPIVESPTGRGKALFLTVVTRLTPFNLASAPIKVLNKQGFELNELEMMLLQAEFDPPIQNRVYKSWPR